MSTKRRGLPEAKVNDTEMQMEEINFKHLNRGKRWNRVKKGSRVQSSTKPRSTAHGYSFS